MTNKPIPTISAPPAPMPLTPKAPSEVKTMDFPSAMCEIKDGKKVARQSWSPAKDYGFMKGDWLTIFTKGGFHTWTVNSGDVEAEDWVVVK